MLSNKTRPSTTATELLVVAEALFPDPCESVYDAVAFRNFARSASAGRYVAEAAPVMSVNVPPAVSALDHCHVVPLMLPSESVRVAVRGIPISVSVGDRGYPSRCVGGIPVHANLEVESI